MNGPLAQILRYNKWANERIIDACRALNDAQLDTEAGGGSYGTIRQTLGHTIDGQRSFLARLGGRPRAEVEFTAWPGFDVVAEVSATTSDALISAAGALVEDEDIVVPYAGKRPVFPKSFFLTHAIAHGIEHRTQIGVMLTGLGIEPPNLDGWAHAEAAGFGQEAP